ncbi:AAA family ATPase [Bacteroidota bacterium]
MIRRVAITGPESTGKSILASQLAEHFETAWVPEFAREYIDQLGRPYEESDILAIAKGQLKLEKERERELLAKTGKPKEQYLFCDTEGLVTKIWSDVKFGRCNPWILHQIGTNPFDLYLLCYIDIPWEYDPQREHPEMREQLFTLYHNELLERNLNFRVVSGLGEERLNNAIKFVETSFINRKS